MLLNFILLNIGTIQLQQPNDHMINCFKELILLINHFLLFDSFSFYHQSYRLDQYQADQSSNFHTRLQQANFENQQ